MTEKLQQTIKEEVAKLPKDAQDAINAFDWIKVTEEIGKKYLLTDEETNNFQVETLLVLVGLTDPQFYPVSIENQVGTTKDDAQKMSDEATEKIFIPIANAIEENLKKNLKNNNLNPKQTINFILSGGDYSAFIEQGEKLPLSNPSPSKTMMERGEEVKAFNTPSLADIQANIKKTNI